MAVTYTATPLGNSSYSYRSVVRNVLVSVAAGASEVITLVHYLGGAAGTGVCPTEIRAPIRFALGSAIVSPSGIPMKFAIVSHNASQTAIAAGNGATTPAMSEFIDIIAEYTHSIVS
jgi:hypothetical protein